MTLARTIVERCGVEIVRTDASRRVVYGEVMLPAPPMEPGQRVEAKSVEGRLHYDGGYMTQPEIVRLCDKFAERNCPVDVQHDGIGRDVTAVESYLVREKSDIWTLGAWVVGVKVHDEEVWRAIEDGALRAFSIQFVVRVREFEITIVGDGGVEQARRVREFSSAVPQFLSLVNRPATGAVWKLKDRAARILSSMPVVDRTWDAAGARERVHEWCKADDAREFAQACLVYDGRGGGVQVADVEDDRLVVVRQALDSPEWTQLADDDEVARATGVILGIVARTVVPFQDLPMADAERPWDAQSAQNRVVEWAGGADDWDPRKLRRAFVWYDSSDPELLGSYKLGIGDVVDGRLVAVPRAVFAAAGRLDQTDVPSGDVQGIRAHLGRYYEKMDRDPPWDEEERSMGDKTEETTEERDVAEAEDTATEAEPGDQPDAEAPAEEPEEDKIEEPADEDAEPAEEEPPADATVRYAVIDGVPQVAPDDYDGTTYTQNDDGTFEEHAAAEEEPARPAAASDVGRATSFGEAVGEGEFAEALWAGAAGLHRAAMGILDAPIEPAAKLAELQRAINDFGQWALNQVAMFGAAAFTSAESPLGLGRAEIVERAGRKMSGARLKKLRALAAQVMELLGEVDDEVDEKRSVPDEEPAQTPDAIEQLGKRLDKLGAQLERVARVRPAASLETEGQHVERKENPVDIVAKALLA